jgi:hypothetical protein
MSNRPSAPLLALAALVALAGGLSACGKTGELQQPAPLFGAQAKADYDAKKRAEAEAEAAKRAQPQPASTDPTAQPLDQAPYAQSLPGQSGPFSTPAQGALPTPGTPGGNQ